MEKNNSLVKAINKNVRTSPRKLALVCNFIKGKKADIALRDLEFSRKRIAKDVSKTVKSAISNAENNNQFDIADFTVLLTSFAILFLENSKSRKAKSAFLPFMKFKTRDNFLGLVLTFLLTALTVTLFFSIISYHLQPWRAQLLFCQQEYDL